MRDRESNYSAASIIEFCQFARAHGLTAGVQQTLAALEAVAAIGESDREKFALTLRTALTSSKEEWDQFLELFDAFWNGSPEKAQPAREGTAGADLHRGQQRPGSQTLTRESADVDASAAGDGKAVSGASAERKLQRMDFSNVPIDDLASLEEISLRLFRRMSLRLSRRLKSKEIADRVNLRRTIRRSIPRGGDPIVLAFQGRKTEERRLVIFLDISGSMNAYSLFLVRFAYALHKYFKRVATFLFSTEVVEITDELRTADLPGVLRGLSEKAAGWAGGTKIGESLEDFRRRHARKLLSRNTVFLILSDGWDTGEPEILAEQVRAISKRVQKLIWLNPLLGLKEYAPVTRGMAAALPYVDVFAPAHNLESLLALERLL
jgi:uncharacterized protein with von Willebrand factor type A (vWA) domain